MPTSSIWSCPSRTEQESIKQFAFTIFNSIQQVPQLQWNQLIPEANLLMQYDQLSLLEAVNREEMEFRYVFIKKEGTTIGVAYFQLVRFTGNNLLNYFPEAPASGVKKVLFNVAKTLSEPLIKIRSCFSSGLFCKRC